MATQIYAVPDEQGVIHVACGEDILEIVVVQRAAGRSGGGVDDDQLAAAPGFDDDIGGNWLSIDDPYVFAAPEVGGKASLPRFDVDHLLKRIRANASTGTKPPLGVRLNVDNPMDLHDMTRLSSGLDRACPGVGLAVDFSNRRG